MSPREKGPCPICGTSPTNRRTKAEVRALDESLLAIAHEIRPATVRQVFYQAVVRGLVPKCEAHGYRVVQRRLLELRESGTVPYDWITDNARMVRRQARWDNPEDFSREVASRYRRDYWAESDVRVEIWMEKDALAGVLYPVVVEEFGLDLYVTRGFSSATYLHEAAEFIRSDGRDTYVYLLTDFDPSGIAIAEKVERELKRRAVRRYTDFDPNSDDPTERRVREWLEEDAHYFPHGGLSLVEIERLAVTREQVDFFNLPTRPTKQGDTRARKFMEEHGTESVELDAIQPDTLRSIVREAIETHMEPDRLRLLKMTEEEERAGLAALFGGAA